MRMIDRGMEGERWRKRDGNFGKTDREGRKERERDRCVLGSEKALMSK